MTGYKFILDKNSIALNTWHKDWNFDYASQILLIISKNPTKRFYVDINMFMNIG